ncbi:interleukin-15 isoform X1 [Poeciliopsis prolifica]|uniref:interleukin-15 isoform X1 n=1 Tax=Poeciliopsis prolifica TaxID=188132 RepID=UPI002414577B|nr:interleukin-15 isoform X1 [Poeciliopsis prolifica]
MIEEFMTALQVILLQLSLPRDQRAKSDLFQSTWKLCCRDSHKTQVWLCFFTLSFLTSCASATPIKVGDLQTCLEKELKVTIEKSTAKLYSPKAEDMTVGCQQKVLSCYMLELMMVFEEEDTEPTKTQCVFNFNSTLSPETNCPECEIHSLENSTVFYERLLNILQKINVYNA